MRLVFWLRQFRFAAAAWTVTRTLAAGGMNCQLRRLDATCHVDGDWYYRIWPTVHGHDWCGEWRKDITDEV